MLLHRAIPAMGKSVLPYEQAYNDLTTAVARAKLACRKLKTKSSKVAKFTKHKQLGRPAGSKDTKPRKKKSRVESLPVHSGSSESMAYSDPFNHMFCAGFNESAFCEATGCFLPEIRFNRALTDSPTDVTKGPPCWELPLPC